MKYHRLTRTVSLITALLLLCAALTSCGARPIKATKQDSRVVATCGGYEILYDEFRYITLAYRDEYTARYGDDVWTDEQKIAEYLPQLTEDVIEGMKINAAILGMCADFGIHIEDDDIQDAVQQEIEATIEALGGRAAYKKALKSLYMTDRFVRYTMGADLCESALNQTLLDAELIISNEIDFLEYALQDPNMCATYHIFIGNDEGDDVEANRAMAEEAHAMLTSGTEITSLIGSKYNEDIYASTLPYYFMKTEYEQAYEDAAFALEIGELSDVIEAEDGFYIIERQPLKESQIVANLTELYQRYQYIQVEALLEEYRSTLTPEWTEYGQSLNLLDIE